MSDLNFALHRLVGLYYEPSKGRGLDWVKAVRVESEKVLALAMDEEKKLESAVEEKDIRETGIGSGVTKIPDGTGDIPCVC